MGYGSDREMLDWHGDDSHISVETNLDIPECLWNGVINQREEDMSCYMFDKTTPAKACVDMDKEAQQGNDAFLQVKRRRMLQFQNEEMPSVFLKTKDREDSFEEALSDMSQWVSSFSEDSSGNVEMDPTSKGWLDDCFNNCGIDVPSPEASDVHIDTSGFSGNPPEYQALMVQKGPRSRRPKVVSKGRKSDVRTQTKTASSIAYPFDIIKPCAYHGDTTLKEINQRLHSPSSSRQKPSTDDSLSSCPTSAFSGKAVVGKTKIHTEGGRGSITIMKTKG